MIFSTLSRIAGLVLIALCAQGQLVQLRPVERNVLPEIIDGNTAAYWDEGILTIFHSSGVPTLSRGTSQFDLSPAIPIHFSSEEHKPVWFEAVWRDADGTLLLWYHHEPKACENGLTAPKIGAAISRDGGLTVEDLGIILEAGDPINCGAQNGFFGSGHGDMSAAYDAASGYFYFFFTNYGGAASQQGVATARMAFADRYQPVGKVFKFYSGEWKEAGLRGLVTPIFPARSGWERQDADSFWGPSVHWNRHLGQWVMLLNHACCDTGWPQSGIYITFNSDLAAAGLWKQPRQILNSSQLPNRPGFYPQILGLEADGTDSLGGRTSRLYVHGISDWEMDLDPEDAAPEVPVDDSLSSSFQTTAGKKGLVRPTQKRN